MDRRKRDRDRALLQIKRADPVYVALEREKDKIRRDALKNDEEYKRERRKKKRKYREDHPEIIKAQQDRSYRRHAEKCRARASANRIKYAEELKLYFQNYYLGHAEEKKTASRAYQALQRATNPEEVRRKGREKQARKRANGGKLSKNIIDVLMAEQGGKCPYCFDDLIDAGFEIDHFMPISKGGRHEDSNVQLTCPTCNGRKAAKYPDKFLKEIDVIGKLAPSRGLHP